MSAIGFWGPYYSEKPGSKKVIVTDDNIMPVEVEESSGFHVVELHAPSMGVSFFALVAALIAIGFAYGCYKKCCSSNGFTLPFFNHPVQQAIPMNPIPPPAQIQTPDPLQPMLQLMALQQAFRAPAPSAPSPLPVRFEEPRIYTLPEEPMKSSIGTSTTPPQRPKRPSALSI